MQSHASRRRHAVVGTALCVTAACCIPAVPAFADDKDPRPAAGIQDNSFLIEEAYNQEAGSVQHTATLQRRRRDWEFSFSQEWALGSQTHQLGYEVPFSWLRSGGQRTHGLGDASIQYRYQAWLESATLPAFAPGVALIVPTGSRTKETGDGSLGYEIIFPFSKIVSDRVTLNANVGMSSLFDVDGRQPTSFKLGGSAIYAVTRDFNLMLEALGEWEESVNDIRQIERERTLTISPGFRAAVNFADDSQLVYGVGAPITLARGHKPDYGVFFYLSYEHNFLSKNSK